MSLAALELDLEVFTGPFDLLMALVLREEIDLMELQLAEVVLSYLDHLERSGELDLESATEFIVLIAALLELKSRLLIGHEQEEELAELEPEQAAQELLERMLQALRYRRAGEHLRERLAGESGVRFRRAPLPAHLRRVAVEQGEDGSEDPHALGAAIGALLRMPPTISLRHLPPPRVSVTERLQHLRALLRGGTTTFDEAVRDADDRATVAVTLFALLELHRRGEARWEQRESFGEIAIHAVSPVPAPAPAPAIAQVPVPAPVPAEAPAQLARVEGIAG